MKALFSIKIINLVFCIILIGTFVPAKAEYQFNQWWHVQTYEETYTINNTVLENRFNLFYHDTKWFNTTCSQNEIIKGNQCYSDVYRKWFFEPTKSKRGIKVKYLKLVLFYKLHL